MRRVEVSSFEIRQKTDAFCEIMKHTENKFRIFIKTVFLIGWCAAFLCGCNASEIKTKSSEETFAQETASNETGEVEVIEKAISEEENLRDNMGLYASDDDTSVITMYLTVSRGNASDGSDHTWEEVNKYSAYDYQKMGVDRYKVEGVLQIDETGEGIGEYSFGYGSDTPNVSVQVRGQSSSTLTQKSYKIRIKDGKGKFRGQRTLNLNKHVDASYRYENKLCYDLLKDIPQLLSGRTQFVHLYVRDETGISDDEEFADYGLYTMIEQVNRTYMKSHGLDENGQLYKVSFFEWNKYDAVMMSKDDPEFDQEEFDSYLEEKGDGDPTKLQEVINGINNYSMPIEKIVEEHFDIENLSYWMAFNILNGNTDTGARNLFLYSPLNSKRFYFISWDMDATFNNNSLRYKNLHEGESWNRGMPKFLGLTLVNRMMKVEKYRRSLESAVFDLYCNYMTPEKVQEKALSYAQVVKDHLYTMSDRKYAKIEDENVYMELSGKIGSEVQDNYEYFIESMKCPWPFFVDLPSFDKEKGEMIYSWGMSYDYNGEEVVYDYLVARDPLFEDVVYEGHELKVPMAASGALEPGVYYLKVTSKNESGYSMDCFDYYSVNGYGKSFGCYCFKVDPNGKVENC